MPPPEVTGRQILEHSEVKSFLEMLRINPALRRFKLLDALQAIDPVHPGPVLARVFPAGDSQDWSGMVTVTISNLFREFDGFTWETPPHGSVDLLLVVGTTWESTLARARYAAKAMNRDHISVSCFEIVGTDKGLTVEQQAECTSVVPLPQTAYELCCAAALLVDGQFQSKTVHTWHLDDGLDDTYSIVCDLLRRASLACKSIAVVGHQPDRLALHLDLMRVAKELDKPPYDFHAVGCPDQRTYAPLDQLRMVLHTIEAAIYADMNGV